jgi:hypothetical protein
MIRQYYAQRCRGGPNPLRVGVIPAGAIFNIQDDGWWRDRYRGRPVCREPWLVEAFLNGTVGAGRRNAETGRWEDVYVAGRSDMALVRSLRTGRRRQLAVRLLILHEDEGLRRDEATYPDLPAPRADGRLPAVSNRAANRLAVRISPSLLGRPSVVHARPGGPAAA